MSRTLLGKGGGRVSQAQKDDPKQRKRLRLRAARKLQAFNTWCFGRRQMMLRHSGAGAINIRAERVATCGVRRRRMVGIKRVADGNGRVTWNGIETCGSVWACLACAPKIRARRAEEIDHLAKAHLAAGGVLTFITFTLPHVATDSLEELLAAVDKAWRNVISGKGWQYGIKAEFGIIGQIKAVEATIGCHGWHPHLHVLFFHDKPCRGDDGTLERFRDALGERWGSRIERQLGRSIHEYYGVDAKPVRDDDGLGQYISKIHYELARSDLKQGDHDWNARSPWQVGLDAAATGDAQDIARWVEWYWATKGRRAFSVSPVLRTLYGKTLSADKTDEEIAAEEQAGVVEAWVSSQVYDALRNAGRSTPALADALLTYEDGGLAALTRYIQTVTGRSVMIFAGERPVVMFGTDP